MACCTDSGYRKRIKHKAATSKCMPPWVSLQLQKQVAAHFFQKDIMILSVSKRNGSRPPPLTKGVAFGNELRNGVGKYGPELKWLADGI